MKPPRSLKIFDSQLGHGRTVVPGDTAVCRFSCSRHKGDLLFASPQEEPFVIRIGARDYCVGIEYGLIGMQIGGKRTVEVPPNLTYVERKIYSDIPENAVLIYELELIGFQPKWDAEMKHRLAMNVDEGEV